MMKPGQSSQTMCSSVQQADPAVEVSHPTPPPLMVLAGDCNVMVICIAQSVKKAVLMVVAQAMMAMHAHSASIVTATPRLAETFQDFDASIRMVA